MRSPYYISAAGILLGSVLGGGFYIGSSAAPATTAAAISLHAMTSPVVTAGKPFSLRLQSNRTGFGHLYLLNSSGKIHVLLENLAINAHEDRIYGADDRMLVATKPYGHDRVLFVVTTEKLAGFCKANTCSDLKITQEKFRRSLNHKLDRQPRAGWAYAETMVSVAAR